MTEIVSTMGSGSIGRELDLQVLIEALQDHIGDIDVNPHSSGIVTIHLTEGGPAYTVYRTGTFQIRGAKDEQLLEEAQDRFLSVLNEIGVEISDYDFEQKTAVYLENLNQEVNLEALTIALGLENTEYEPEQFAGLIFRPAQFEVTILIFASGKVIIGGTVREAEANAALQYLKDILSDIKNI